MIPCFFSRSFRASALGLPTLFHPPLDYARGIAFCRPTPPYALSFVGGTGSHGVRSGKTKSLRAVGPLRSHDGDAVIWFSCPQASLLQSALANP